MKIFVKEYVALLEDVLIGVLGELGVAGACRKAGAPGVYVPYSSLAASQAGAADGELAKIAALGIKLRNGCAYHGLALNVDMDPAQFLGIKPCGSVGLKTVTLRSCEIKPPRPNVGHHLARRFQ